MNYRCLPAIGCFALCTALLVAGCEVSETTLEPPDIEDVDLLEVYDPLADTWTYSESMPTPRSMAAACEVGGRLYVIGGAQFRVGRVTATPLNVVEAYDPATGRWATVTLLPTKRWGAGAGVIDGRIFVIGGAYSWRIAYAAVEIYDPSADLWTAGSQMEIARYRHAVEVIDGLLYVAGGLRWTENEVYEGLGTLLAYDPVAQSWDPLPVMNVPRDHPASGVIDGKLYIVGGWLITVGGFFDTPADVLEVYDPAAGGWTVLTHMPTARSGAAAGVISGRLYVAGGMIGSDLRTSILEIYDPVSDTWTTGREMSRVRAEASSAVVNGKLYVAGGY